MKRVPSPSPYDSIARLYDPWSRSVVEDVAFYVEEASRVAPGPLVELGVGTGRIAVPIASAGIDVIGVDSSAGMLAVCAEHAGSVGVSERIDLRLGDFRRPPVTEHVDLVIAPFRSFLHLRDEPEREQALAASRDLLHPGGRLVFDVFSPGADDIRETHGQWLEREPGIFERADWDTAERTLTLSVRDESARTTMIISWLSQPEWHLLLERAGFTVEACLGWFDGRPWRGGEDMVWVATRR